MKTLNRTTANLPVQNTESIMQFGADSFSRAFCSWIFNALNNQTDFDASTVVISEKEEEYSQLAAQEGLFHVALDGLQNGKPVSEVSIVESVSKLIEPNSQWEAYLSLAEQPQMRYIVSSTQGGIKFSSADKFTDTPPKEFPAKLTVWLYRRFTYYNGAKDKGCIMLPCESINDNGSELRKVILSYAQKWNLGFDFQDWITENNHFCDTLVDRTVLGYPKNSAASIQEKTGFIDPLLVAAGYYHSWVINARSFVQRELPFSKTNLNVKFVEDLSTYKKLHTYVLNGAQVSLSSVSSLAENKTFKEAMSDNLMTNYLTQLLYEEVKPTVKSFFSETEIDTYIQSVHNRFNNPVIEQSLLNLSEGGLPMFKECLLPTFVTYDRIRGSFPKRIAFSLACLIYSDKGLFHANQNTEALVSQVISNIEVVGEDLSEYNGLVPYIVEAINKLEADGVYNCLAELLA